MKLLGKKALITGGSRGIGRAVAEEFLKEGATVFLVANEPEELPRTVSELSMAFPNVAGAVGDVSNEQDVNRVTNEAIEKMGTIDILVNAAGIYGPIGPMLDVDTAHWRRTYEVNVFGALYMVRAVGAQMKKKGKGKIVIFSGGGDGPFPNFTAYNSSKVAIVRLTETLAEELLPFGIEINAIAPGSVNTKFLDEALEAGEERVGKKKYQQFLKQKQDGGTPREKVAELCLFLGSSASDGLSGKLVSVLWDSWREWTAEKIQEIMKTPAFTLRRVDPFRKD